MITTIGVAVVSGALVVLSPCTLPILPGLLAVVGKAHSGQTFWARALPTFMFAFSVAVGLASTALLATGLARAIPIWLLPWSLAPAALLLAAGLFTLEFWPLKNRVRLQRSSSGRGRWAVPTLSGLALGAAWTPCATPSLALGMVAASRVDSVGFGVAVLAGYVTGVVLPLVAVSVGLLSLPRVRQGIQRTGRTLQIISGITLLICAALVATGHMNTIVLWATDPTK